MPLSYLPCSGCVRGGVVPNSAGCCGRRSVGRCEGGAGSGGTVSGDVDKGGVLVEWDWWTGGRWTSGTRTRARQVCWSAGASRPVYFDVGSGSDVPSTRHWSAYDGRYRRPRAEGRCVRVAGAARLSTRWTGTRSTTGRCTNRTGVRLLLGPRGAAPSGARHDFAREKTMINLGGTFCTATTHTRTPGQGRQNDQPQNQNGGHSVRSRVGGPVGSSSMPSATAWAASAGTAPGCLR